MKEKKRTTLRVLDLFSGTGSATKAFENRGHNVTKCEKYPIETVEHGDIFTVNWGQYERGHFDVVWISPPCPAFSMAGKGSKEKGSERWDYLKKENPHWFYGPRFPTDDTAREGCDMVLKALQVVARLDPKYWWLENPMGGLVSMGFMERVPGPAIVTYCQYGETRMKATHLWGQWPKTWKPRPRCKNGDPCHQEARRGARTGTQGLKGAQARGMIPYDLSLSITRACEEAIRR